MTTAAARADCPLCGSAECKGLDHAALTQGLADTEMTLLECRSCRVIFLDPMPEIAETSELYTQDYYGDENVRFLAPVEAVSRWFRSRRARVAARFESPGRVLDIGCGRGEFLTTLADRGWEAHGVEINATAAQRARARLGEDRVHLGDVCDAGYPDAHFDLVSLYHVIEHVPNPREVMAEIHRVLRPGGLMLYSTPNGASWGMRWFRERAFGMGILHNCYYFSAANEPLFLGEGFEKLSTSTFSLEQDPFSYLQCLLNRLGPADNYLYRMLHRDQRARLSNARMAWTLILSCLMFAPALALAGISPLTGAGYTTTHVLRRN